MRGCAEFAGLLAGHPRYDRREIGKEAA